MGYEVWRLVLATDVGANAVTEFAMTVRETVARPGCIRLRDLAGRRVRRAELVAARDAGVRVLDMDFLLSPPILDEIARCTLGEGRYILRLSDDDEMDVTLPDEAHLAKLYPGADLGWLLLPEEDPVPWNTRTLYICPWNPSNVGLDVPIMLSLLSVALPGQRRPCPACRHEYVSRGERGQCPQCGFVAHPFPTREEALTWAPVLLDAFCWGKCPRCYRSREFTYRFEQCLRCGQLLRVDGGHPDAHVTDNASLIQHLLRPDSEGGGNG